MLIERLEELSEAFGESSRLDIEGRDSLSFNRYLAVGLQAMNVLALEPLEFRASFLTFFYLNSDVQARPLKVVMVRSFGRIVAG